MLTVGLQPQLCPCSERLGVIARHPLAAACIASPLCSQPLPSEAISTGTATAPSGAFVTVAHIDKRHARSGGRAPQLRLLSRLAALHANLKRVGSKLPLHTLLSGECATCHVAQLRELQQRGVLLHALPIPPIPLWANPAHYSSFGKLHAWNLSLILRQPLLYLDVDTLLLRNVDYLLDQPAPAVVFRADRYLLNGGVMLIHTRSRAQLDDLWGHFRLHFPRGTGGHDPRGGPLGYGSLGGDGGDQELMVSYWSSRGTRRRVYELPVAYNAFAWQMDQTVAPVWCNRTAIVHKIARIQRMGQKGQVRAECVDYVRAHAQWAQAPLPGPAANAPNELVVGGGSGASDGLRIGTLTTDLGASDMQPMLGSLMPAGAAAASDAKQVLKMLSERYYRRLGFPNGHHLFGT
jgi:hypothetical protein